MISPIVSICIVACFLISLMIGEIRRRTLPKNTAASMPWLRWEAKAAAFALPFAYFGFLITDSTIYRVFFALFGGLAALGILVILRHIQLLRIALEARTSDAAR